MTINGDRAPAAGRLDIAMLEFDGGARLELFAYARPDDRRTQPPRNCDLGGHHVAFATADVAASVAHVAGLGARRWRGPSRSRRARARRARGRPSGCTTCSTRGATSSS